MLLSVRAPRLRHARGSGTSVLLAVLMAALTAAPAAADTATLLQPIFVGSDGGVQGDFLTNDDTPRFAGHDAIAGASVTLYAGAVPVGSQTVSGNNWSITSGSLANGTYDFTATQTVGGIESLPSPALTLTIQKVSLAVPGRPELALESQSLPGSTTTSVATPTILGTGPASTNISVALTLGYTGTLETVSGPDGGWSVTLPSLPDTTVDITATAWDVAGNVSGVSPPLRIVIDTIAPQPLSTLFLGSECDSRYADSVTNHTTLRLYSAKYSYALGSTLRLFQDGTFVGSSALVSNWWSVTVSGLADGTYAFTATTVDDAGNESGMSPATLVTVDTVAPAPIDASALVMTDASDSGVKGDFITSEDVAFLVGRAEPGASILFGPDALPSATVSGSGDFTAPFPLTAEGPNVGALYATDLAGNVSAASASFTVVRDTTWPDGTTIALAPGSDTGTPNDNVTADTTPTLVGRSEAGATVTIYDRTGSDAVAVGTALVDALGDWTYTFSAPLEDGWHWVSLIVEDPAGHVAGNVQLGVSIRTSMEPAPPADLSYESDSGMSGNDNLTNVTRPTLVGSYSSLGTARIRVDADWYVPVLNPDFSWRFDVPTPLHDGPHVVVLEQTDGAGNTSLSEPFEFTIDTVPPAIGRLSLDSASDSGAPGDGITNDNSPALSFHVGGDAWQEWLTWGGQPRYYASCDAAGACTTPYMFLDDGRYTIAAQVKDIAGNVATSPSIKIEIDTTPPPNLPGPGLTPGTDSGVSGDAITNVVRPTLTGSGAPAGALVTIVRWVNGDPVAEGTVTADEDGAWTWKPTSDLPEDVTIFAATVEDEAGNRSTPRWGWISIDTTAPVTTLRPVRLMGGGGFAVNVGIEDENEPCATLYWSADAHAPLSDYHAVAGCSYGDVTIDAPYGTYYLYALSTDIAGNTEPMPETYSIAVDYSPLPTPPPTNAQPAGGRGTSDATTGIITLFLAGLAVAAYVALAPRRWGAPSGSRMPTRRKSTRGSSHRATTARPSGSSVSATVTRSKSED